MLRWSRHGWRAARPPIAPIAPAVLARGVRNRPHFEKPQLERPHFDKRGTTYTEVIDGREVERTVLHTPAERATMDARAKREIAALLASSRAEAEAAEANRATGAGAGSEKAGSEVEGVGAGAETEVPGRGERTEAVRIIDGRAEEALRRRETSPNYTVRKERRVVHGHEVETEIYNFPAPGQSVAEMEAEERGGNGPMERAEPAPRDEINPAVSADVLGERPLPPAASTGVAVAPPRPATVAEANSAYRYSLDDASDASHPPGNFDLDINIDIEGVEDGEYTVEIDIERSADPHLGPHGTALQHQRWMERHLSSVTGGERTSDVLTPLRAAHAYLDEQSGNDAERADAYWRFLREFLKHPDGGRPALDLIRRQAAERVPFTVEGAVTAFKAARSFRPMLRELLPIMPAEMTTELVYIFAVALVNEQRVPPDAVRTMIAQSLAAVRSENGAAPPSDAAVAPTRSEVPTIEWSPELFFPVLLAHMPFADFRGALRTLNDLRAAVRAKRDRTIAAGGAWPGRHARAVTKCYTATMSLWLRSQLDGDAVHPGRVGERLGSAVPHRLATDLGNLLAPVAAVGQDGGVSPAAAAEPIRALAHALDAPDGVEEKYHFRYPFLNAWLNAERAAGNVGAAAGVWALISGQSVAATVAGHAPPRAPNAEAYESLFRLLRDFPPASYRPAVAAALGALGSDLTTGLLNKILAAASFVPKHARTDWAALTPPWEPARRLPFPAPAHVANPDLALLFVLAEEHVHLLDHRSLNILCAALIRASRLLTISRGAEHPVLLSTPTAALTPPEWKWLEQALWATELSEARRTGRAAHKPPPIPVDAADLWDTERWRGQIAEGEGRARWLLVDHVSRPLRRQLVEGMIELARSRGARGSNAEVFTAELRGLQGDMGVVDGGATDGGSAEADAQALAAELGLVVPPREFVHRATGRGKGRGRNGLTRSAAAKTALDGFFAMMDFEDGPGRGV